jgi:hypothetical protein
MRECDGVGHASRSSGLLHVEASWASVFESVIKTVGDMTPSRRLRQSQVEDGQVNATDSVGPYYTCFTVFILLDPRRIVVIYFFA